MLADSDDTGLEVDCKALLVASDDATVANFFYEDADRGGTDEPIDGELGIGADESLISGFRRRTTTVLQLNDEDNPTTFDIGTYFAAGGSGNDLTVYLQTLNDAEVSFSAASIFARANQVRFTLPADAQTLLDNLEDGDRWIFKLARAAAVATDHMVDADPASWGFAATQPDVTHTPAATPTTQDHTVNAGAASWEFAATQPVTSGTAGPAVFPDMPTGVDATFVSPADITVRWVAPPDDPRGPVYRYQLSLDGGLTWIPTPDARTTYTFRGLPPGSYKVRVRSENVVGVGLAAGSGDRVVEVTEARASQQGRRACRWAVAQRRYASPRAFVKIWSLTSSAKNLKPLSPNLKKQRRIETAEGVWLDAIGLRLGVARPSTTEGATDPRFGFDDAGEPFDIAPFTQGTPCQPPVSPLGDDCLSAATARPVDHADVRRDAGVFQDVRRGHRPAGVCRWTSGT